MSTLVGARQGGPAGASGASGGGARGSGAAVHRTEAEVGAAGAPRRRAASGRGEEESGED